jgi:hypothetical protein
MTACRLRKQTAGNVFCGIKVMVWAEDAQVLVAGPGRQTMRMAGLWLDGGCDCQRWLVWARCLRGLHKVVFESGSSARTKLVLVMGALSFRHA